MSEPSKYDRITFSVEGTTLRKDLNKFRKVEKRNLSNFIVFLLEANIEKLKRTKAKNK